MDALEHAGIVEKISASESLVPATVCEKGYFMTIMEGLYDATQESISAMDKEKEVTRRLLQRTEELGTSLASAELARDAYRHQVEQNPYKRKFEEQLERLEEYKELNLAREQQNFIILREIYMPLKEAYEKAQCGFEKHRKCGFEKHRKSNPPIVDSDISRAAQVLHDLTSSATTSDDETEDEGPADFLGQDKLLREEREDDAFSEDDEDSVEFLGAREKVYSTSLRPIYSPSHAKSPYVRARTSEWSWGRDAVLKGLKDLGIETVVKFRNDPVTYQAVSGKLTRVGYSSTSRQGIFADLAIVCPPTKKQ